jgi:chemotaxis protein methyltransferase CheR
MVDITEKEFSQLSKYIQNNYGIHLREEKKTLVTGRLHNVLLESNCRNFSEYFNLLQADKTGKVVTTFINKITTNHTYFMRETDHFDYFRDKILPYLENTVRDKDLRIWSAGCSTGEEPSTLAMILSDYFGKEKMWWDTKILATDISDRVIEKAKKAQYSSGELASLPITWRTNYFKKINSENSVLIDKMRNEIIYRKFNLMEDTFPFKRKLHVIFCRNVMIYFDNKTKMELINKFYEITEPGGYLFIGHSESLSRQHTKYKYVLPSVYRKE